MSHGRVLEALVKLGLSNNDAEIYIYLAKEGPQKVESIAEALKIYDQQLKCSLESLRAKGVVSEIEEQIGRFRALPFNAVLDLLLKAHWKETRSVEQSKMEILSQWKSLTGKDPAR